MRDIAKLKVITFVLVSILGIFIVYGLFNRSDELPIRDVRIGDKVLKVELADSPEKRERGLMWRENLPIDAGMLFVFDKPGEVIFWNQNTLIPLDVIWIRHGSVIGVNGLPAINAGLVMEPSPGPVDYVLEVNQGWAQANNIQSGTSFYPF